MTLNEFSHLKKTKETDLPQIIILSEKDQGSKNLRNRVVFKKLIREGEAI